jgi:predicted nucleotide-binding protein (sugar kinase/HSP70/actin superfamily)
MLIAAIKAAIFGDILQNAKNRMLPYELQKGETMRLYHKWMDICKDVVRDGGYFKFQRTVKQIIKEFDNIPIDETMWKPKVGIVGEILAKYHPVANNHIEKVLIEEGAEVVMPDFVDFFLYSAFDAIVKHRLLDGAKKPSFFSRMFINVINFYRRPMRKAMLRSRHFRAPHKIDETARLAERHVSLGNMAGEGWFLTGEMVKLIDEGVPNVVCLQPFGCLPNHITGKGVMHELRESYKGANITAIDCDAGSSEVNQLNRLKLMLSVAKERGPEGDFATYEPQAMGGPRP